MENNHRLQYYLGDWHRPNLLDHPTLHQRCFSLHNCHFWGVCFFFYGSRRKRFSSAKAESRIKKKMIGEKVRGALPSPLTSSPIVSFLSSVQLSHCVRADVSYFLCSRCWISYFTNHRRKNTAKKRQLHRLEVFLCDFQGCLRQSRHSRRRNAGLMSKKADKVQSKLINTKESATYLSKIYKM